MDEVTLLNQTICAHQFPFGIKTIFGIPLRRQSNEANGTNEWERETEQIVTKSQNPPSN